jgi:hypothetical protein
MIKRKSPDGLATSDVIVSAYNARNADVFPHVLALHVAPGAIVADVTWGKGVFWKQVPKDRYIVHASDIQTGTDCRELPYASASHDCVVLDPPYMEGLFRRARDHMAGAGNYGAFRQHYSDGKQKGDGPRYHAAVLDLYFRAGKEAHRILKGDGVLIVKCQDEVSANQQHLTHIESGPAFDLGNQLAIGQANTAAATRQKSQCICPLLTQSGHVRALN